MSEKFDPSKHLRTLRGRGGDADYLDVKWRLVWLRDEHPDAEIDTEMVRLEERDCVFRARVAIPGRGHATGWGSESAGDFRDFIEKAETKALGRALAALGYGTQFVGDEMDEGERIADSPVDRTPQRNPAPTRQIDRAKPEPYHEMHMVESAPTRQPERPASTAAPGNGFVKYSDPGHTTTYEPQKAARAELEARKAPPPPLTETQFDKLIDDAWTLMENGGTLDDIRADLNAERKRMSEAQRIVTIQQLGAIETAIKERDAVPAKAPFTPTNPPPASHAG